ncbi:MAG: phosphoribosyltransferase family protein [Clostridiaceae bacterium]|nr:phosphoribosyltransferase family protein [Clostridiaceae bacterium]
MKNQWPEILKLHLGPEYEISLALTDLGNEFYIYSFDMTGEAEWNREAAKQLTLKLAEYDFYSFVTVQTKSSGLTQMVASSYKSYLELRKSPKGFMKDPKHVVVKSITTEDQQELWIGKEKYEQFQGKKLCFIDDVVSTGGTIDAVLAMAKEIGFEISVIACVLTEGEKRTEYKGIPLISLDHLPLPGFIDRA